MVCAPLKAHSLCCHALLLLLTPLLSPTMGFEVSAARVSRASIRISAELGKAHKLTAELSQEGVVTSEEKKKLDVQFAETYRHARALAQEVFMLLDEPVGQAKTMSGESSGAQSSDTPSPRAQLTDDFGELVEEVTVLKQTISNLSSKKAQESYQPFLKNLGEEIKTLAVELRCDKVDNSDCVKCSDGKIYCP